METQTESADAQQTSASTCAQAIEEVHHTTLAQLEEERHARVKEQARVAKLEIEARRLFAKVKAEHQAAADVWQRERGALKQSLHTAQRDCRQAQKKSREAEAACHAKQQECKAARQHWMKERRRLEEQRDNARADAQNHMHRIADLSAEVEGTHSWQSRLEESNKIEEKLKAQLTSANRQIATLQNELQAANREREELQVVLGVHPAARHVVKARLEEIESLGHSNRNWQQEHLIPEIQTLNAAQETFQSTKKMQKDAQQLRSQVKNAKGVQAEALAAVARARSLTPFQI